MLDINYSECSNDELNNLIASANTELANRLSGRDIPLGNRIYTVTTVEHGTCRTTSDKYPAICAVLSNDEYIELLKAFVEFARDAKVNEVTHVDSEYYHNEDEETYDCHATFARLK